MATGLLRPDGGTARILGHDVWADPAAAKAVMGISPDGMRLFERLSGRELLTYVGALRRMPREVTAARAAGCSPCSTSPTTRARSWPTTPPAWSRRSAWPPR